MKILITGGAGFIGSHVVQMLAVRGNADVVVDNINDIMTREYGVEGFV